jgi:hypothetical protein
MQPLADIIGLLLLSGAAFLLGVCSGFRFFTLSPRVLLGAPRLFVPLPSRFSEAPRLGLLLFVLRLGGPLLALLFCRGHLLAPRVLGACFVLLPRCLKLIDRQFFGRRLLLRGSQQRLHGSD